MVIALPLLETIASELLRQQADGYMDDTGLSTKLWAQLLYFSLNIVSRGCRGITPTQFAN